MNCDGDGRKVNMPLEDLRQDILMTALSVKFVKLINAKPDQYRTFFDEACFFELPPRLSLLSTRTCPAGYLIKERDRETAIYLGVWGGCLGC